MATATLADRRDHDSMLLFYSEATNGNLAYP